MPSKIEQLHKIGQSLWLDNLSRRLLDSGGLERLIDGGAVTGITSNPTLFEKAIAESDDYRRPLAELFAQRLAPHRVAEALMIADIRDAADLLWPVYERSARADGYVSLEVSPLLAHDTAETVAKAKALWRQVDRPNLLIKVPGTREGVRAIAQLTDAGISVNVTLLFSRAQYADVIDAYLTGLEARVGRGQSIGSLASVASFFVSRVDTAVDGRLPETSRLRGRVGIANCKLAYAHYREIFDGERFAALARRGGRKQRLLFGSTGTKNPGYSDVLYVEELIGPDTVNTLPERTLHAFLDHGRVRETLPEDLAGARRVLGDLGRLGIDLDEVCKTLEVEGIDLFARSYQKLLDYVEQQRTLFFREPPEAPR